MQELVFHPDRNAPQPVYRQLASYLEKLIENGRLLPGEKLPASRELAGALRLSRNTINQAYQTLLDRQLVHAHVGQGTFVARSPITVESRQERPAGHREFVWDALYSTRARHLPSNLRRLSQGPVPIEFDFEAGRVDTPSLPTQELTRAYRQAIDRDLAALANKLTAAGWFPLRRAIAHNLISRGIECDAEHVMITTGAQQALDLLARVLLDPGDLFAIEQPGYFGATLAFTSAEAEPVGIHVDSEGLDTCQLERTLRRRRLKMIYTTPAVQSPTGVVMSARRREELLALAEEHQTPIIEDDYDGELRLDSPAVGAIKVLDRAGKVVYVGTFSKAVFPGMRLGYVVASPVLLQKLTAAKATSDLGSAVLDQAALTELFESGGLERHVRRVRKLYIERTRTALDTLEDSLPEDAHWRAPAGGNSLWITMPRGVTRKSLEGKLRRAGIRAPFGDAFWLQPPEQVSVYLSVANMEGDDLRQGLTRFAECVWQALREDD